MDPIQLQNWPFTVDATTRAKALTDADSALALPIGGYSIRLSSTEPKGCTLRIGAAAVAANTNGLAAVTGFDLAPGVPMTLNLRVAADLHAIMNAASAVGTLYVTKVR